MPDIIKFRITTLSNLFIGSAPIPFEIGGIDQQTILDQDKLPYIPGSSLKGALRSIIREDNSENKQEIKDLYARYLESEKKKNGERIRELVEEEALNRINVNYNKAKERVSAEYLFGIEGFNNSPKLIFSDVLLCDKYRAERSCFSIDIKNWIDEKSGIPVANPRTYRAARSSLVFAGEIRLYKMEQLCEGEEEKSLAIELCRRYVIANLLKFNEGIHRLGNSKSRGYGKIAVSLAEESEG